MHLGDALNLRINTLHAPEKFVRGRDTGILGKHNLRDLGILEINPNKHTLTPGKFEARNLSPFQISLKLSDVTRRDCPWERERILHRTTMLKSANR